VIALTAGGVAIVAAIAAVVVFVISPSKSVSLTGFTPTGSSPEQDAQQITSAFLSAWAAGNFVQASRYTDHPAAAQAALVTYRKYLHLRKLTGTAGNVAAAPGNSSTPRESVTENLKATVATSAGPAAISAVWNYTSTLVAYQQPNSQLWYIAWAPDVVAPNLTAATHLAAVEQPPQIIAVTDSSGGNLTSYGDAGTNNISRDLMKMGSTAQGTPGLYVEIQTAKGVLVPNSQAVVMAPNNIANLSTTIDPRAEAAARVAVAMHNNSAMVAIQPSTGKILAIANNAQQNDFALTGAVAPGSSMKVITATALLNAGLVTATTPVACPKAYTVQGTGITYHNDAGETLPASTPFSYDFAQSCNNAFTQWWPHLYGKLASTAKDYYGLNQNWDIGIANLAYSYFNADPHAANSELAQEAFGEGSLVASPLAMASVAATVDTGVFKQPIVVPGVKQVTATPLPASTDAQLKQMMRDVVTQGTAAGIGLGPNVYAKTGTADIQGQGKPNSWFVAFDPTKDVAVGFLVINAGYGAQFAGPEAKSFLDSY
jgi:hypothetical protein